MWLVVTLVAAIVVTMLHFLVKNKKYKLDFFALMLWGTFIMVFVDHVMGYILEPGDFIEIETDGIITNGALLGIVMIIPLFLIWLIVLVLKKA